MAGWVCGRSSGKEAGQRKGGVLGVTAGEAGDRLPSHSIRKNHLLMEPVEKEGSTSTIARRRTVGRMFRRIKEMRM